MTSLSIQTVKGRCRRCYICIRSCPIKAIGVKDGQAYILAKRCLSCGSCVIACHQGVHRVRVDKKKVANLLKERERIFAILDPSFVAAFPEFTPEEVVGLLKRLGFEEVWDGSFGTYLIIQEYKRLLKEKNSPIISSQCHAIVNLIERHYPELIPNLAPVVSPMIALGRFIKDDHGKQVKVVYIGPCIAKKDEIRDGSVSGAIDEVLIFRELKELLNESLSSVAPGLIKGSRFDGYVSSLGRLLPMAGGLSKNIGIIGDISTDVFITGGSRRCIEILDGLKQNRARFKFLDITFCQAGCPIDGPAMDSRLNLFERRERLIDFSKLAEGEDVLDETKLCLPNIRREFKNRSTKLEAPTEDQIRKVLNKIGKFKPEDELNCGVCGYSTCREKAEACIQGLAEIEMCLPFLIEKIASSKEEEIKTIIESMNDGLVAFDKEMHITLFNQTASRITGFPKNQAIGRSCWEIFHTEVCQTPNCPYLKTRETGENRSNYESTILTMEGIRLPIRASVALLYDEKGEVIGGVKVFTDISKQKEMEQMKEEFISHVSHELRTPLASIKGATDLLLAGMEGGLSPGQENFLKIIKNNTDRLIRLIEDILDLSKIESGRLQMQMRLTDLGELIKDVVSNIKVLAEEKGLIIETMIPDYLPRIPMDGDRIKQVLVNLISNAVKYSPSGRIQVGVVDCGKSLKVSVTDTGIGIDPKDFKRIFEKFQPVDPHRPKGMSVGLGLSICKGIIQAHQGEIWVEKSELGRGSTFSFTLPKEKRRNERELFQKATEIDPSQRLKLSEMIEEKI